jgi:hypothetical protein
VALPVEWQKPCFSPGVPCAWVAGAYINMAATMATSAAAIAAITAIKPPLPNPFIAALMYHPPRWSAFSLPYTSSTGRRPRITALPEPPAIYPSVYFFLKVPLLVGPSRTLFDFLNVSLTYDTR